MDPKIFVAIPAYGGISANTVGSLCHTLMGSKRTSILSIYPDCALVALARSNLLGKFLSNDCTHLFFIDADISFDKDLLTKMLGTNRDVVVAPYVSRRPPYDLNMNRIKNQKPIVADNDERILEIHSTGLGCCLVTRKAIEDTCKLYAHLKYVPDGIPYSYALFLEEVCLDPDDIPRFMGEDIMFFTRLREAGYPTHAMVDVVVEHCGTKFTLATYLEQEQKFVEKKRGKTKKSKSEDTPKLVINHRKTPEDPPKLITLDDIK